MAENVQRRIEEMLPELESMENIGLFSAGEVRRILKKRKTFEYRLQRKTKLQQDFKHYIEYEENVLKLVRKKRQKMRLFKSKTEIDFAIAHRIFQLYRTVCNRFQADPELWLSYIDFCRGRNDKSTASKVFTRMLQVHNDKPLLYVKAAKFELEENNSMENARFTLLQGIRFNKGSHRLWQEYFRLELLNTARWLQYVEELNTDCHSRVDKASIKHPVMGEVNDAVLRGDVAKVVFISAMDDLGENPEAVAGFLNIALKFAFAADIENTVMEYLSSHHKETEVYWGAQVMRATSQLDVISQQPQSISRDVEIQTVHNKSITIFEEAISALPTEKMFDMYLDHLENLMKKSSEPAQEKFSQDIRSLCERASKLKCLSEEKAQLWLTVLEKEHRLEELQETSVFLIQEYPECGSLWLRRIAILTMASPCSPPQEVFNVFREATKHCSAEENVPLWNLMNTWLKVHHPDQMPTLLEMGEGAPDDITRSCRVWALQWAGLHGGIKAVRKTYKRLHSLPPYDLEFFKTYLHFESTKGPNKKCQNMRVRDAYEEAVHHFGADNTDIWFSYMSFEKEDPLALGQIYDRAMRTLRKDLMEEFTTRNSLEQLYK